MQLPPPVDPAGEAPAAGRDEDDDDDVVVRVHHVTSSYGDHVVLRDVDMTVRRGEVMVILGGSGCGKSTLLKQLIGLLKPDSGEISVLGTDVLTAGEREMEELYQRVGIVYQTGALFGSADGRRERRAPAPRAHEARPEDHRHLRAHEARAREPLGLRGPPPERALRAAR